MLTPTTRSTMTSTMLRRLALLLAITTMLAACAPSNPDAETADGTDDTTEDAGTDTADDAEDEASEDGDTDATTGEAGGTLVIGTTADVVNLNPLVGNSRTDTWVTNLMYPRMMDMDLEGTKTPSLATAWSYSEDGLTATVNLRDDFTWSDGEPVDAEDVMFTIDAIKAEQFGVVAGMIAAYESSTAPDPHTIEFTLSRPDGAFLNSVGFWMPIVPEHVFSAAESVQEFANDSDWVSAGPYRLTDVQAGDRYTMTAVDSYPLAPDGTPTLDEVVFRVFPDVNTEVLALRNGDIDLIGNAIPPTLVEQLQDVDGLELVTVPSLGWAHMQYNMRREPLDQLEVRQALAHAVDYEAIRQVVLRGQAVSSGSSPLTPSFQQWYDDSSEEYAHDPERSRELLESAGQVDADGDGLYDGLTLEMVYDSADPNIAAWAEIVRDQSREAGIDIQLSGLERNTYLARTNERDFDIYAGSWAIIDEPQSNFSLLFFPDGFINYAGVEDPDLVAAIENAAVQTSVEEARPFVQEAGRIVHDNVYDNVMYVEQFNFAHSSDWEGFVAQPSELLSILNPRSLAQVVPAGE